MTCGNCGGDVKEQNMWMFADSRPYLSATWKGYAMTADEAIKKVLELQAEASQTQEEPYHLIDFAPQLARALQVALEGLNAYCDCSLDGYYKCNACIDLAEIDKIFEEKP